MSGEPINIEHTIGCHPTHPLRERGAARGLDATTIVICRPYSGASDLHSGEQRQAKQDESGE